MTTYIPAITLPSAVFSRPAVSILVPVVAGMAVGYSFRPYQTQATYLKLKQPPYRPPPEVFGPVWTMLYGLMGYSAYRAWSTGMASMDPHKVELTRQGATLYTIQLGLNLAWMPLFFALKRPIEAAVDNVVLTGLNAYLAYLWWDVDEVASWVLAPYVAWLGFASYLAIGVGHLNDWNIADKESTMPPSSKVTDTKYVDEADHPKNL